jgi:hypothetical protein
MLCTYVIVVISIWLGSIHSLQNHRPVHGIQSSAKDMNCKIANPLQNLNSTKLSACVYIQWQQCQTYKSLCGVPSSDGSSLNPYTNFQFLVRKSKQKGETSREVSMYLAIQFKFS